MFGWFQRLLPQKGDFFGMFEGHAATLVAAAQALQELAANGGSTRSCCRSSRIGSTTRTRLSARC